jgi:hypothetical protein
MCSQFLPKFASIRKSGYTLVQSIFIILISTSCHSLPTITPHCFAAPPYQSAPLSPYACLRQIMDLATFLTMVTAANPLIQSIPFRDVLLFLATTTTIKNDILLIQLSNLSPSATPDILPHSIQNFLSQACGLPIDSIVDSWSMFRHLAWHGESTTSLLDTPLSIFDRHGILHGFSASTALLCLGLILIPFLQLREPSIHPASTVQ